ncbi:MAG: L28 family ribosomal protein [Cutibacterium avidum]|nr:L28 family ribosomal protein [Cutibacterium avidum]
MANRLLIVGTSLWGRAEVVRRRFGFRAGNRIFLFSSRRNPRTQRLRRVRHAPNIQRVRVVENGTHKRMNVCTSCLKAGRVSR